MFCIIVCEDNSFLDFKTELARLLSCQWSRMTNSHSKPVKQLSTNPPVNLIK